MRPDLLVESEARALDLTDGEARLLAQLGQRLASRTIWWGDDEPPDRSVVSVTKTPDGQWIVRVAEAIGLLQLPNRQIIVQPKIPPAHFAHLAAWAIGVPRIAAEATTLAEGDDLLELVARWYIAALRQLLRQGLLRDYVETTKTLPVTRGHLLTAPTARNVYSGRLALVSRFDEFDFDTPLNRTLLAATRALARIPTLNPAIRREAERIGAGLGEIGPLRGYDLDVTLDRRTQRYATPIALARHILAGTARSLLPGRREAWAFLLRTPLLIEAGVRALLEARLLEHHVRKEARGLCPTAMTLNPDLVFDHGIAIADVKYRLTSAAWSRDALQQAVTFAVGFEANRAAVCSFSAEQSQGPPRVRVGNVNLSSIVWRTALAMPPIAEAQFVHDVRLWLEAAN